MFYCRHSQNNFFSNSSLSGILNTVGMSLSTKTHGNETKFTSSRHVLPVSPSERTGTVASVRLRLTLEIDMALCVRAS